MAKKLNKDELGLILVYDQPSYSKEDITVILVRPAVVLKILNSGPISKFFDNLSSNLDAWLVGFIGLAPVTEHNCGNVFDISGSAAQKGYGPLIYDLALSATFYTDKVGIIPDRTSITDDATVIWDFYYDRRDDIYTIPLRSQDCPLYGEVSLDSIFAIDTPSPYYSALISNGDDLVAKINEKTGFTDKKIGKLFYDLSDKFFAIKYTKGTTPAENPKPKPKNKRLYEQVKREAMDKFDVYPSIYANSWVVREYKKRGGTYSGDSEDGGLTKWYAEKWVNVCERGPVSGFKSCGRPSVDGILAGKYPACRPLKKAKKLSEKQIKSMCKKKRTKVTKAKKKSTRSKSPVYVSWPK